MSKTVVELMQNLDTEMQNLRMTFDRKKSNTECPKCGTVVHKHMLKRHQQTKKCARKEFDKILKTLAEIGLQEK